MAQLVASAKPGMHVVKTYSCYIKKSGYLKPTDKKCVNNFVYSRVRKMSFIEQPTQKAFLAAIFRLAHNKLINSTIKNSEK